MTTPTTRVPRQLRNADLAAIDVIASAEELPRAEMVRLALSFATFKWRTGWRGAVLGQDDYSVKLLPAGIDAVKTLAEHETLSWDAMAAQLLAFAAAEWVTGWRKDVPGRPGAGWKAAAGL